MRGGFKEQLRPVGLLRGDHGEPRVFPDGHVVMLLESEDLGVEGEGLGLVVDEDVGQCDPHVLPPFEWSSCARFWGVSPTLVSDTAVGGRSHHASRTTQLLLGGVGQDASA